jgi:hypothetical protein
MWLEELVANTLAVAYTARYEPEALTGGVQLAERVLGRAEQRLSPEAQHVLDDLLDPARPLRQGSGYGLDLQQTALVQLAMIRELARRPEPLETALQRWLTGSYANAS